MEINILKNTGKIVFSIFLFFFPHSVLYAADVQTELSPSKIAVGESASLRIKITGKSAEVKPVKFPAVNGLQITFSGSSRNFNFVNGKTWSGTVLNFSIYAEKKGEYKVPPFILEADGERVSSREVTLIVKESSAGSGGGEDSLRGDVEIPPGPVYTGEPFIMRYFIYDNGESPHVEGFSEQPHVKGFVTKGLDERIDNSGKTLAASFCMVPVDKGVHDIGGGAAVVAIDVAQGFFSMPGRVKVLFPYKKINIAPIPADGKTSHFKGDVGEFKIEAEIPSGKFKIFEEIKIPVKISGKGNLLTLSNPQIENEDGIKMVIEEKEQKLSITGKDLSGEKNFLITLILQIDGNINPGRIFIEYFNPYKKIYEKAESIPLIFEVQKGDSSSEKGEVQFASKDSSGWKLNYLHIILALFAIAVSVLTLVMWERKKLKIIKSELGLDSPGEDVTPELNKNSDILKNLQISAREKNHDMFLLNADRGINCINSDGFSAEEMFKYNSFKEKIYFCRYGGGVFAESDMAELSEWLKKNMK